MVNEHLMGEVVQVHLPDVEQLLADMDVKDMWLYFGEGEWRHFTLPGEPVYQFRHAGESWRKIEYMNLAADAKAVFESRPSCTGIVIEQATGPLYYRRTYGDGAGS